MEMEKISLVFVLCHYFIPLLSGAKINKEQLLLESLLKNYNKQARPVEDPNTPTNVTFGMELVQLIKVEDRAQSIVSKVWIRQMWINEAMKWNSSKWFNVKSAQIDSQLLWVPDIVLYNNADDTFSGGQEKYKTRIVIYPDGSHYWLAPATFTSTCKIDITYFPFDRQECMLKFGSWTYDVSGIDLLPDARAVITSQYKESSEWKLVKATKKRNSVRYACCPIPYSDVTITIVLQRKPLYYVFNVISPCFLLIATILFGFYLPPESGERISLTITILLAVAVFLQLVSDNLPRNSDSVPLLGLFYMTVMAESALSLITTCVVLIVHYKGSNKHIHPMPRWIRKLFVDDLGSIFGIRRMQLKEAEGNFRASRNSVHPRSSLTHSSTDFEIIENGTCKESEINGTGFLPLRNGFDLKHRNDDSLISRLRTIAPSNNRRVESTLDNILHEVKFMSTNLKLSHTNELAQEEWRILSIVLDRFFFWLFLVTCTISSIAILVPVYKKYH